MKSLENWPRSLIYILSGIFAITIVILTYIQSRSIDPEKFTQLRQQFSLFHQKQAVLNQNVLEIRQGIITNYDLITKRLQELDSLEHNIRALILQTGVTAEQQNNKVIQHKLETLQSVLKQKKVLLEKFKTRNAILRNSLLYLPLATSRLSSKIAPVTSRQKLQVKLLNTLLKQTLIYVITNDRELLKKIERTSKQLDTVFISARPELKREKSILLTHNQIIIENFEKVDRYTRKILALPVEPALNMLQKDVEYYYSIKNRRANLYRQFLTLFSIILLLAVIFAIYKLNRTRLLLRRTVNDLSYQKFAMDQHAIVSITDSKGIITYANQKFCDISQYKLDELLGKSHNLLKSAYHPPSFYKHMWNTISQGKVWHGRICNITKNGNTYWLDTTIVPFVDNHNKPYQYVAISTDITVLKENEEHLFIQATALETVENGIVITDSHGNILWVNDAACRITGYSQRELLGKNPRILKSGKQDKAFYENMWQILTSGQSWQGEMINRHKDGHLYTEEETISPVHDDQGNIIRYIAVKQDISERKLQEEKIRHSQKMDALGQLTGGIAHDYNNMLGIVLGYTELLEDFIKDDKLKEYLQQIHNAANRGARLTQKLLAFSRHRATDAQKILISDLLEEDRNMLEKTLTSRIQLELNLPDEKWYTCLDSSDLEDAILNMCINAMHAIKDTGKITIRVENQHLTSTEARHLDLKPADYVLLSITDDGCGMSKEIQERIFDPFFSTKGEKGTGLGMSQVYGFVDRSHGTIRVYSEPGVGTRITLYFPRYIADSTVKENAQDKDENWVGGSENILIVDDEPSLLVLGNEILSAKGYRVFTASGGKEALAILKKENIDLLISDVIMPEMDGHELTTRVKQKYPQIKIILASGFNERVTGKKTNTDTSVILYKPYKAKELLQLIRKLLDND